MSIPPQQLLRLAGVLAGSAAVIRYSGQIREAIQNLRGAGPRPPSHPLPSNDSFILNRRRTRRISQD
jgi:hypothetical protein